MRYRVNTAGFVISKFGGQGALARLIGKGPSTVQYWAKAGNIPAKWHSRLLSLAAQQGIDLAPGDLVEVPGGVVPGSIESPTLPEARWPGMLPIGDEEVPVYVLDDGRRVISRTGALNVLAGRGGGNLESYLRVEALRPYVPSDLAKNMIQFTMPGVVNKTVLGLSAETFLDVCRAYVRARDDGRLLNSERQTEIAIKAGMFLAACANVGLIALIDEVTGFQYQREQDALSIKLKLFLEDEMRKWEKTFPDELWKEFGRLTNWQGTVHQRPKYWGHLVMELIYEYLDPDVAEWLRKNAPKPQHAQNYHQWLSGQYGLKKLIEHIWMVIGMASACQTMAELKRKMAEKYGRIPLQYTLWIPSGQVAALPQPRRRRRTALDGQQARLLEPDEITP